MITSPNPRTVTRLSSSVCLHPSYIIHLHRIKEHVPGIHDTVNLDGVTEQKKTREPSPADFQIAKTQKIRLFNKPDLANNRITVLAIQIIAKDSFKGIFQSQSDNNRLTFRQYNIFCCWPGPLLASLGSTNNRHDYFVSCHCSGVNVIVVSILSFYYIGFTFRLQIYTIFSKQQRKCRKIVIQAEKIGVEIVFLRFGKGIFELGNVERC